MCFEFRDLVVQLSRADDCTHGSLSNNTTKKLLINFLDHKFFSCLFKFKTVLQDKVLVHVVISVDNVPYPRKGLSSSPIHWIARYGLLLYLNLEELCHLFSLKISFSREIEVYEEIMFKDAYPSLFQIDWRYHDRHTVHYRLLMKPKTQFGFYIGQPIS